MPPLLRVCQDLSVFKRKDSHLVFSFRVIGSQSIRQQLLEYANTYSSIRLQL